MSEDKSDGIKTPQPEVLQPVPYPTSPPLMVRLDAVLIILDDWEHHRLHNTSVSHNTQIWNQVSSALNDLKTRLKGLAR